MECLNTDANATKKNLGKKRAAVGPKPGSLVSDNMKKPLVPGAPAHAAAATTAAKDEDNEDSSDVDLGCLACGS